MAQGKHQSFNQETTLSGKSIIRNIRKAKQNGFYVVMNYMILRLAFFIKSITFLHG